MVSTKSEPVNTFAFVTPDGTKHQNYVPPKTKEDLANYLELFFGLKVASTSVCDGHCAPLDAIAASYFAESPVVIWVASRGFGGKTRLLSALSKMEMMLGANITLLGGSGQQSRRIHQYVREAWEYEPEIDGKKFLSPFTEMVPKQPNNWGAKTNKGNSIEALTASTKSARGAHPERLRLDEVDEMREDVYDSSLGQPMSNDTKGIRGQTTISSTHQYPDGLMTRVLEEAAERGWPVYMWCYKESHVDNGGWLTQEQIDDKRQTVSESMWDIEYELQEPSIEGRVLSSDNLHKLFCMTQNTVEYTDGKLVIAEPPFKGARYVTGCDWGKTRHFTEIVTLRTDVSPVRLVAYERVQGKKQGEDYKHMKKRFEDRMRLYGGRGIHDANGVGDSIADFMDPVIKKHVRHHKVGNDAAKESLYMNLVMSVEEDDAKIVMPRISALENQFKYLRDDDIRKNGHPPDGVSAVALAWAARVGGAGLKGDTPGRMLKPKALRV